MGTEIVLREFWQEEVARDRHSLEGLLRAALEASVSGRAQQPESEARSALDAAANDPHFRTIVAERGASIVGILIGSIQGDAGFVLWMAVAEEHRRRGIAHSWSNVSPWRTNFDECVGP